MAKTIQLAVLAAFLASQAAAQAGPWAQCGGLYHTGPTTCQSGWTCVYQNDWYSQCLQGSGPVTSSTTSARSSTSTTSSRSSSSSTSSRSSSASSSTRSSSSSTTIRSSSSSTSIRSSTTTTRISSTSISTSQPPNPTGNPYGDGHEIWLTPYYAAEVDAAAALITDATQKAKALKVKNIPTFTWFDVRAKVPTLGVYLADAYAKSQSTGKKQLVQIVVYDLPNRDCHANASNGELFFDQGGAALYQDYIDGLAAHIANYPSVRVVAVVEPDSLANLVTNLSDPRCSAASAGYKSSTTYAIQKLSAVGAYLYLDAGHAGWLGWPANITPAAQLFSDLYTGAGKPAGVRGLATNVANYNALVAASPDPVTPPNNNYDEIHYINALAPMLEARGFPAHFIVDQGRSGVQNIRTAWGNWCNIEGAGFGIQPTTNTGSPYIDAIVWIKPGGEADGTSNTSATRYDQMCGGPDAKIPAPEAGTWFQAYFEDLVRNANPAL